MAIKKLIDSRQHQTPAIGDAVSLVARFFKPSRSKSAIASDWVFFASEAFARRKMRVAVIGIFTVCFTVHSFHFATPLRFNSFLLTSPAIQR